MDIAVKKIELIEWLARVKDEAMITKIENLKNQSLKETYEASLKPMSSTAYKSMLEESEQEYQQGKVTLQKDLEKESENW